MSSIVYVKIIEDSTPPKMKKLNLNNNLSDIRKEFEKKNIDMNLLLFAEKLDNDFAVIDQEEENNMSLNDIIFNNSGRKFLYLLKNSSPSWNYLNNKCKLEYGCTISFNGIKKSNKK